MSDATYIYLLKGGGGCDYTIACNVDYRLMLFDTEAGALAYGQELWDDYSEQIDDIKMYRADLNLTPILSSKIKYTDVLRQYGR